MPLTEIVNELIGMNKRMIMAAGLSEFLQCQLTKCNTVERPAGSNEVSYDDSNELSFFFV
jgi:hypothetical protein